ANPLVAETALKAFGEARRLAAKSEPAASLVFAVVAIELGLKKAILEPIVNGLVHSAPAAALVTELTLGHRSVDQFRDLLFSILREEVNMDMTTYTRSGSSSNVWQEIGEIQNRRNSIVHRGESTSTEQAGQAIEVATWILDQLFPAVVRAQGLHLHDAVRICNERHPSLFKP